MSNWSELYKELANTISSVEKVKWIDLWHDQINFLETEHRFPAPAVFLNFRILNAEDIGEKAQMLTTQIEVYVFYETFADTYKGSVNQNSALEFLNLLDEIHKTLHGSGGEVYNNMRRTGTLPIDTGNAGNLYQLTFECQVADNGAKKQYVKANTNDVTVGDDFVDASENEEPDEFIIPQG